MRDKISFGSELPPERSLWLREALSAEAGTPDAPRLTGAVEADVCIVGGGYTGLWTALRVKELEPTANVVVVEADICGGGASGRNGGLMDPWSVKLFALSQVCGPEEAIRLCHMTDAAIDEIAYFCESNGIDAHLRRAGGLWVAANPSENGSWRAVTRALSALGHDTHREVSPADLPGMTGTSAFIGGTFDRMQASIQPALLARGLRRVALEKGVTIFEHSPITRLRRGKRPAVMTANGTISAKRIILAMGAWLAQVSELSRNFVIVSTDMIATEPAPALLDGTALAKGVVVSDSRVFINYFRTTHDGRLAWGKGGPRHAFSGRIDASFHGASSRAAFASRSLRRHYPDFAAVRITDSWTGPIDRTALGIPNFDFLTPERNIVYGGGYSGIGIVPSFVGGRILASLALGRDDEYSNAGVVGPPNGRFPAEPIRYIGGDRHRGCVIPS